MAHSPSQHTLTNARVSHSMILFSFTVTLARLFPTLSLHCLSFSRLISCASDAFASRRAPLAFNCRMEEASPEILPSPDTWRVHLPQGSVCLEAWIPLRHRLWTNGWICRRPAISWILRVRWTLTSPQGEHDNTSEAIRRRLRNKRNTVRPLLHMSRIISAVAGGACQTRSRCGSMSF